MSDNTATQVWTYLKSYGYSDSVAAGILGNMMRECGGDTLNLDWDIVGHYRGDEFYGLCQWRLRYTPSGFNTYSIKQQCDYLHQTMSRLSFLYCSDLPHRAVSVYVYLDDRANKDGECWTSIKTIAKELKLSRSTVRRALCDLRKANLVETVQRYRKKGGKSSLLFKLKR